MKFDIDDAAELASNWDREQEKSSSLLGACDEIERLRAQVEILLDALEEIQRGTGNYLTICYETLTKIKSAL